MPNCSRNDGSARRRCRARGNGSPPGGMHAPERRVRQRLREPESPGQRAALGRTSHWAETTARVGAGSSSSISTVPAKSPVTAFFRASSVTCVTCAKRVVDLVGTVGERNRRARRAGLEHERESRTSAASREAKSVSCTHSWARSPDFAVDRERKLDRVLAAGVLPARRSPPDADPGKQDPPALGERPLLRRDVEQPEPAARRARNQLDRGDAACVQAAEAARAAAARRPFRAAPARDTNGASSAAGRAPSTRLRHRALARRSRPAPRRLSRDAEIESVAMAGRRRHRDSHAPAGPRPVHLRARAARGPFPRRPWATSAAGARNTGPACSRCGCRMGRPRNSRGIRAR